MKKWFVMLVLALGIAALAGCGSEPAEDSKDQTIGAVEEEVKEPEQQEEAETPITVSPLPETIELNEISDCTLAVSIENGAVGAGEAGTAKMKVTVYDYEVFDLVDISKLEAGSIIELNQELITIETIETNELGTVVINGGLDVGGYELATNEDGVYYSIGYSDVKSYYEIGETELEISPDFTYVDASDLENGEKEYTLSDLTGSEETVNYEGTPHNTTILVENGVVTSMVRRYIP